MLGLLLEELFLLLALLVVLFVFLCDDSVDRFDLRSQLHDSALLLPLLLLKFELPFLKLNSAVLGLKLLAHSECDGAVVERLVSADVGVDVALDSEEEQATLGHVQRYLADNLLEALLKELLAYRANPTLTGLALHKFLVEHFSQAGHIDPLGGLRTRLLHPVFTCNRNRNAALGIQINLE